MSRPESQWHADPVEVATAHAQAKAWLKRVPFPVLGTTNLNFTPLTTVLAQNFHLVPTEEGADLTMYGWSFDSTRHVQNVRRNPERPVRLQIPPEDATGLGTVALHGFWRTLSAEEVATVVPLWNAKRERLNEEWPNLHLRLRDLSEFTEGKYPKTMHRIDFYEAELPVRALDPNGEHGADGRWVMATAAFLGSESPPPGELRVG